MNRPDSQPEWPVEDGRPTRRVAAGQSGATAGLSWSTIGLIAALILIVSLIAYVAITRNPDQDKLTGRGAASDNASAADPSKLCASKFTYNLIKRDIFRRAAQVRGSDQATYDKLSNYAVLRMENPVMESQEEANDAVNCSGSLAIDLPPGLAVVGGRKTLNADVDYTVQPAADGSGTVVLLRNADAIVTPLATLARVSQPTTQPQSPVDLNQAVPAEPGVTAPVQPQPPAAEQQSQASSSARPSFDCANARTKGEIAVCSDSGLAALDRNMAAQFGRAMAGASPDQAALLRRTRDRFLAYRDQCPNRSCIGDAYVGRMREIRDIMEGRWQPSR